MKHDVYHTSPEMITSINKLGVFGSFLCFAIDPYVMTNGDYYTYQLSIDDSKLIKAGHLFYHEDAAKLAPLVSEFCQRFGIEDEDLAEEIISERESEWHHLENCDAEASWECQLFTARAARMLGYEGCIMQDEQGALFMIDMLGRESELVQIGGVRNKNAA